MNMREKIYNVLNKIYAAVLMVSFFAGVLPLVAFVVAMIIGGDTGEAIAVFLYKDFYPWVIVGAAVAVWIGWIASYVNPEKKAKTKKKEKQG